VTKLNVLYWHRPIKIALQAKRYHEEFSKPHSSLRNLIRKPSSVKHGYETIIERPTIIMQHNLTITFHFEPKLSQPTDVCRCKQGEHLRPQLHAKL